MIQKKGWLSQLQLEEIRRLVESGENNFEAQQEEQNRTGTETLQQVTERAGRRERRRKCRTIYQY